ncbi:zinc-dependent alcohol dehydrogenase family protein [Mesorhizobium sp. M4B.F.Ca.ET.017.02.2.1]|uniref:zinc-dependent alcohol dehydrogenase family protein n=1 Tax=Mesorhizobium sp. M4B.F.Ca.ET.017.02.2.1 TaxID=2496649 RepID=UPI000FC9C94F|nr:zinc-dependent alcohol dehydrogenase family protein [Mesorhizobium sp. M4B.F.Ca.ET.017.02.2.1]RVD18176.1 zinc-binding dehydrogenase [Mesorhizobium sp. M4B.F.Ca.ET.017.02.2.1]
MKAIRFAAAGVAGMAELDMPEIAPGHALVRVRAAGLCHTDIEVLHGHYGEGAFPLVPGHEYAGTVEAVAADVTTVKPGDRVAVDPNIPCGHCPACRKGLTNLCASLKAYGVTANGGFAEFSLVAVGHLHDIGDLGFATAALAEPLACVLNGLGAAGIEPGARVPGTALVFGAGPIGLLLALSLKARGVVSVAVADISEPRLAFAGALGLEPLVSGSQALAARAKGFDFVADATGVAKVVEGMVGFTADGGTALVFGVCAPDARISVAPFEIFRRQIRLAGSHSLNRNIPQALDILKRDDGTIARLVSHRLPLAELLPFFAKSGGDPATMKVQFSADM